MTESWDEMRKAKEEQYFQKANKDAISRLGVKRQLNSPVTGDPMITETLHGVVVHRCPNSGGVWLEKGELEHLTGHVSAHPDAHPSWIAEFFKSLLEAK